MTSTSADNSYWNNIQSDQLFDIDDFFTADFGFNLFDGFNLFGGCNQNCTLSQEDGEGTSSSSSSNENDHNESSPPQQDIALNLICRVCGAQATGYNFDQITCESCKAFFRRNALRNIPDLKCRYDGNCVIDARTRRLCTYCRLKKCFDINMRKDWIRTDEEKQMRQLQKLVKEQRRINKLGNARQPFLNLPIVARKKKRLRIKQPTQDLSIQPMYTDALFVFNHNLSDEDNILLNNITNTYQSINEEADVLRKRVWTRMSRVSEFLNRETDTHRSLINFYKLLPEFNQLDIQDRVLLIKSNLIKLIHLHCLLIFNFQDYPNIDEHMNRWIGKHLHQPIKQARVNLHRFMEHPLILKLSLIVFIFNMSLSVSYDPTSFADYSNKTNIRKIEQFYTSVLWRYLNIVYDEKEAIRSMDIIVTQIVHLQLLMSEVGKVMSQQVTRTEINELEISLFRLTC